MGQHCKPADQLKSAKEKLDSLEARQVEFAGDPHLLDAIKKSITEAKKELDALKGKGKLGKGQLIAKRDDAELEEGARLERVSKAVAKSKADYLKKRDALELQVKEISLRITAMDELHKECKAEWDAVEKDACERHRQILSQWDERIAAATTAQKDTASTNTPGDSRPQRDSGDSRPQREVKPTPKKRAAHPVDPLVHPIDSTDDEDLADGPDHCPDYEDVLLTARFSMQDLPVFFGQPEEADVPSYNQLYFFFQAMSIGLPLPPLQYCTLGVKPAFFQMLLGDVVWNEFFGHMAPNRAVQDDHFIPTQVLNIARHQIQIAAIAVAEDKAKVTAGMEQALEMVSCARESAEKNGFCAY